MKKIDDNSMWKGASPDIFSKAKKLRNQMTEAETLLWERLKSNQLLGYKFRRQHPISRYIADFYCHKLNLIIELDGGYHTQSDQIKKDKERTEDLNFQGVKVIKFTNDAVLNDIDLVISKIQEIIKNTS